MRERKAPVRFILLFLLVAALAVGQSLIHVSSYECPVANLPEGFVDFRILQLSDLHGAEFGTGNKRLIRKVAAEKPDIIVLTGDFVEDREDLAVTGRLFPALADIAPCYFVSGNHEWAGSCMAEVAAQLEASGAVYLKNEYLLLKHNDKEIILCGVDDPNSRADLVSPELLVGQMRAINPGKAIILLAHRNYWIREYPELPVELILCGHGHGGIVRIPGIGGLVGTDRLLFPEHTEGIHQSGSYHMVVSRGLGRIYGLPRIFNNPEIVVATLKKEA